MNSGSSYATLVTDLKGRIAVLKGLNLINDTETVTTTSKELLALDSQLAEVEHHFTSLHNTLTLDLDATKQQQNLVEAILGQAEYLRTHVAPALPVFLPGNAAAAATTAAPKAAPSKATGELPTTTPLTTLNADGSSVISLEQQRRRRTTLRGTCVTSHLLSDLKPVELVSQSELDKAPPYMTARLTVQKVNAVIHEIHDRLVEKYRILSVPAYGSLPPKKFAKFKAWKEEEVPEVKGRFFFTDNDVRTSFEQLKLDPIGRNILMLLRHLRRLQEVRGGGLVRYVIATPSTR